MENFKKELEQLINKHSVDTKVNIPDFILAETICSMIEVIGQCCKDTRNWYKSDKL